MDHIQIVIDWIIRMFPIVAAVWGFHKWDVARREKRAEFLESLLRKFQSSDISKAFYELIERPSAIQNIASENGKKGAVFYRGLKGENRIPTFNSSENEVAIDRLLLFLSYICYLKARKLIDVEEYSLFAYQIDATLADDEILKYLTDLKEYVKKNNPYEFLYDQLDGKLERNKTRTTTHPSNRILDEETLKKYLVSEFGGMTASASSVLARARRVCKLLGVQSLDKLVSTEGTVDSNLKKIEDRQDVQDTVKANLKNAVRHCYKAKYGRFPGTAGKDHGNE